MQPVSVHPFGAGGLEARQHRLDNGLTILLVADRAAPVIAYQTWFAVGSRHEKQGKTGIAHLFEHLMFNETESRKPGEFDRLLETVGGETNAATWVDWTYYRNNLPKVELQLAVELESDRMAHLVVHDPQVNSEREVVANERRFRVEDDVDGFLDEQLHKLAFTVHPYHWPTIGWMEDIHAISTDDARAFYKTYYAPNNATVILVGDFDEAEALALLERHYGPIPPSPIPLDSATPEPLQTAERRRRFEKPVAAEKLQLGYKSPPLAHPDYAVLEVLSEILLGGNSSRLHRRLIVEKEIASTAYAAPSPFRDPGLFQLTFSLQRGHHAGEIEEILDREIARLIREPVGAAELETAKTRLLTQFWQELRPHAGKAEALGQYHTTTGDYKNLFVVAERYRTASAEQVADAARRYLDRDRRTVVIAAPPVRS